MFGGEQVAKPALRESQFSERNCTMRLFNRKTGVVVAALVLIGVGGTAFAYFTSTGSGATDAATGDSTSWAVTTSDVAGDPLTPGGPTDTVEVTVANNNSGVQSLNDLTVAVADKDGKEWNSGKCTAADFAVKMIKQPTFGDVASGASVTGVASVQMVNRDANQDDCKNVKVPLYFYAS